VTLDMSVKVPGWHKPTRARKWHFFANGNKSLCERWTGHYEYYWPRGPLWKPYLCKVCERMREELVLADAVAKL